MSWATARHAPNAAALRWLELCGAMLRRGMRATISGDEGKGFLKLIVAKDTDKLVGAHFVGSEVAEIMQASRQ